MPERCEPGAPAPARRERRWLGCRIGWLIGLAVLAGVVIFATHTSEPRDFVRLVERSHPRWLAVALALQAATYAALAQVWRAVARAGRQQLRLGVAIQIALAKLFLDQTLPSGGVSGSVFVTSALEQRRLARAVVIAAVALQLASYYVAYAACLGIALAFTAAGEGHALVLALGLGFAAVSIGIAAGILALARAARPPRLRGLVRAGRWLQGADRALTGDAWLFARATGWQIAIVLLDSATMWTLLRALDVEAPVAGVFASFMISSLARTLSIMPAGLGVFEGVAVVTLHQIGAPLSAALSAALLFRGLSYWLPMLPGLAASRRLRRTAPGAPGAS